MDNNNLNNETQVENTEYTFTEPEYETSEAIPDKKGLSVTGLVLGIVSLLCCWLPMANGIFAIVGLILSIIGKKKTSKKALATWALILNIVGIVLAVIVTLAEGIIAIINTINN